MNTTPKVAQWSDLFRGSRMSDIGQVNLGKLQMFLFTARGGPGIQCQPDDFVRTRCGDSFELTCTGRRNIGVIWVSSMLATWSAKLHLQSRKQVRWVSGRSEQV